MRLTPDRETGFRVDELDLEFVSSAVQRAPGPLQMLGDRWSLLVLRDALLGARRFSDFLRLTGAPSATLSSRLKTLVRQGVLYRNPVGPSGERFEYRLTERGLGLLDFALCLWAWEHKWGGDSALPAGLIHTPCGTPTHPTVTCRECREPVGFGDVSFEPGPGSESRVPARVASRRREAARTRSAPGVDRTLHRVIDVFGDRWMSRLLAAFFMGVTRYDDLNVTLGISTNILSDRLRRLTDTKIVERFATDARPGYRLTPRGLDLFPAILTVHEWSSRWASGPAGPALLIKHSACGHTLVPEMVCDHCRDALRLDTLRIEAPARWMKLRTGRSPGGSTKRRGRAATER